MKQSSAGLERRRRSEFVSRKRNVFSRRRRPARCSAAATRQHSMGSTHPLESPSICIFLAGHHSCPSGLLILVRA